MQTVAAAAGVSQATVSHALRGTGRVAAATRRRVLAIVQKLGYRPDPLMGALAAYRSQTSARQPVRQTIAVLVADDPKRNPDKQTETQRLLAGINEGAEQWGFAVEVFPHDGSAATTRRLNRVLFHRGIRGVILGPPRPYEEERPRELDWEKFVVIACKPRFGRSPFHSVGTDEFSNGRLIYRRLFELGYRRIGFCFSEALDLLSNRALRAGVWTEQETCVPPEDRLPPLLLPSWHFEQFRAWHDQWQPEVIITMRWEVRYWLLDLGRREPYQVGLAVTSAWVGDYYAGLDQNTHRMGREAVRLLREHLVLGTYGPPDYPLRLDIPSVWKEGASVVPRAELRWTPPPLPAAALRPRTRLRQTNISRRR